MLNAEEGARARTFSSIVAKPSSGDLAGKQFVSKHPDPSPNHTPFILCLEFCPLSLSTECPRIHV